MICITYDQLRAAMTDIEQRWRDRTAEDRAADNAYWLAQPMEVTVASTADDLLVHLKKHGAKQTSE